MNKKYILYGLIVLIIVISKIFFNKKGELSNNKIYFATSARIPPFEFYDEKRNLVGFDIDLARIIAKELKKEAVFRDMPILQTFPALRNKNIDMIVSSIVITSQRKEHFYVSDEYFQEKMIILINKSGNIKNLIDLQNKKVSCVYGYVIAKDWFDEYLPLSEALFFGNSIAEIKALSLKNIDAILIGESEGKKILQKYDWVGYIEAPNSLVSYGILINKSNYALLSEVNQIIFKLIRDGTIEKLRQRWMECN